jgi:hypothetical protein
MCPRYFLFRWRLGLRPRIDWPDARMRGTMFHLGMEQLSLGKSMDESMHAIAEFCRGELEKAKEFYSDDRYDINELAAFSRELDRRMHLALAMVQVFHAQFKPPDPDRFVVVGLEQKARAVVPGISQVGEGTLDMLLLDRKNECIVIRDYKTMSGTGSVGQYFETLPRNYQFLWYRALAHYWLRANPQEIKVRRKTYKLHELPVSAGIVSVIKEPTITCKQWQVGDDGNIDLYLEEVQDYYAAGVTERMRQGKKGSTKTPLWDHRWRADEWAIDPPYGQEVVRFHHSNVVPNTLRLAATRTSRATQCEPTLDNFPDFGQMADKCIDMYGRVCPFLPFCNSTPPQWYEPFSYLFRQENPSVRPGDK